MDNASKLEKPLKFVLVVALIAGAALRFYGVDWGLPAELHIDETHFVPRAIKFGTGDLNPHFFLYPTLYMYMLFAAYAAYFVAGMVFGVFQGASDFAMQYFLDPSAFYIIGRSMTASLNLLTALLVFVIARKVFSPAAGFAAAVLFLFSPLCVIHSHFITGDVPVTFFMTLSFYLGLRMMETGTRRYYLLAGLAMGLAGATKYTGVLLAPTLVVMHLFCAAQLPGPKWKNWFVNLNIYLLGLAAYAGFFIGYPYHLFDFPAFSTAIMQVKEVAGGHWLGMEGVTNIWLKIIADYLGRGVGWPALGLSACGIAWSVLSGNRKALAVSFFVVFYYVFMGRYSGHNFDRYWLPVVPGISILAGIIIAVAAEKISRSRKTAAAAVAAAAILAAAFNAPYLYSSVQNFGLPHTQNIAREWIEDNLPPGTRMALELNSPQLTGNLQSHLDAETWTYGPGDINAEAEKFNVIGTAVGDEKKTVSATNKKYLSMALERKEKKYYLYGTFSLGSHSLDYYRRNGFEYLISNSHMKDRYTAHPGIYPKTVGFYKELDEECELIRTFAPEKGKSVGPEIWIYRLGPLP
ncbi:MAG: glycosyltransferase family 39 protein [bacterium]